MHDHHEHTHDHPHEHHHGHRHDHPHEHGPCRNHGHVHGKTLVLRPYTGVSGDIMVAGLARMLDADQAVLDTHIKAVGVAALTGALTVTPHSRNAVGGWQCTVTLPHEHSHRTLADITAIIAASAMTKNARKLATDAFTILAEAEGAVHGKERDAVSFHEVGALDSILDICLAASLFDALSPALFVCGPLPVCDGAVDCAHGQIPVPAPAVLKLLRGVPVRGIPSSGETVTPTGLALLKAFNASFGLWPAMTVEKEAIVYGTKVFANVPNGALFAFGDSF